MDKKVYGGTAALAVALAFLLPAILVGQSPAPGGKASNIPRTADGKPDLQGYWQGTGISGADIEGDRMNLSNPVFGGIEPRYVFREAPPAFRAATRKSSVIDPPDGRIPYQPWAARMRDEIADNHATNPRADTLDPQVRCGLTGVPRVNYGAENSFQILQAPTYVLMLHEWAHAYRFIPTDGRPSIPANIKLWMGDSRARWEGDTLVVDATNNNDKPYLDTVGSFHSDAMRVVERWRMVGPDTIDYEVTIDDPKVFSRPWKMRMDVTRIKDPGYELLESACHEGERDWQRILTSAPGNENGSK